jgi:hypothetical protein
MNRTALAAFPFIRTPLAAFLFGKTVANAHRLICRWAI